MVIMGGCSFYTITSAHISSSLANQSPYAHVDVNYPMRRLRKGLLSLQNDVYTATLLTSSFFLSTYSHTAILQQSTFKTTMRAITFIVASLAFAAHAQEQVSMCVMC